MTTAILELGSRLSRRAQQWGEGEPFSFGRLFLGLAIWNSLSGAIAVMVWSKLYEPAELVYFTPTSVVFPILVCLAFASMSKGLGIVPILKAYTVIGCMALMVFLNWTPQTEAWLNSHGRHLL